MSNKMADRCWITLTKVRVGYLFSAIYVVPCLFLIHISFEFWYKMLSAKFKIMYQRISIVLYIGKDIANLDFIKIIFIYSTDSSFMMLVVVTASVGGGWGKFLPCISPFIISFEYYYHFSYFFVFILWIEWIHV